MVVSNPHCFVPVSVSSFAFFSLLKLSPVSHWSSVTAPWEVQHRPAVTAFALFNSFSTLLFLCMLWCPDFPLLFTVTNSVFCSSPSNRVQVTLSTTGTSALNDNYVSQEASSWRNYLECSPFIFSWYFIALILWTIIYSYLVGYCSFPNYKDV